MRALLVPTLVLAACGAAYTQSQPPRPTPAPEPVPQSIPPTTVPVTPKVATVEAPPADKTLDQLLDRLETLRGQKAELEKAEAELVKEIRRKLEKQSDRINRLGIMSPDPVVPAAPSLGAGAVLPLPSTSNASPVAPLPAPQRN